MCLWHVWQHSRRCLQWLTIPSSRHTLLLHPPLTYMRSSHHSAGKLIGLQSHRVPVLVQSGMQLQSMRRSVLLHWIYMFPCTCIVDMLYQCVVYSICVWTMYNVLLSIFVANILLVVGLYLHYRFLSVTISITSRHKHTHTHTHSVANNWNG